jgi:hypothetical protein
MSPKLLLPNPYSLLRSSSPPRGLLGRRPLHVLYANVKFGSPSSRKEIDRLLDWLAPLPWSEKRVLRYLELHQAEFRRCLEWLMNGSSTELAEPEGDESERDEFWEIELSKKWELVPEVKFLQEHGLDHGGVILGPMFQTGTSFSGLELDLRKPRDPLDPICWYLLSLLMWDGSVRLSRCKYSKCQKFIHRPTSRRRFCDDNCRAKNAADKKTPEEKRQYMRKYRALPTSVKKRRRNRS